MYTLLGLFDFFSCFVVFSEEYVPLVVPEEACGAWAKSAKHTQTMLSLMLRAALQMNVGLTATASTPFDFSRLLFYRSISAGCRWLKPECSECWMEWEVAESLGISCSVASVCSCGQAYHNNGYRWHAQIVADDFFHRKLCSAPGDLKPCRAMPHVKLSELLKHLATWLLQDVKAPNSIVTKCHVGYLVVFGAVAWSGNLCALCMLWAWLE